MLYDNTRYFLERKHGGDNLPIEYEFAICMKSISYYFDHQSNEIEMPNFIMLDYDVDSFLWDIMHA